MVRTLGRYVSLFTAVLFNAATAFADCTHDQAMNKMLAFNRALSRMMASGNYTPESPGVKATMESAPAGQLIADNKFNEACALYENLAKKFNIDLTKEAEGLITIERATKDGGKGTGSCTQADAHIKMMKMHEQLEDKVALGDMDRDVFRRFGDDTRAFGDLMYTNPSEICRRFDEMKKKYGLN